MYKKEGGNKMKYVDISIAFVFVLALVVISFFWGCAIDPIVTAVGGVIVAASALTMYLQYKKLKDLEKADSV